MSLSAAAMVIPLIKSELASRAISYGIPPPTAFVVMPNIVLRPDTPYSLTRVAADLVDMVENYISAAGVERTRVWTTNMFADSTRSGNHAEAIAWVGLTVLVLSPSQE
jgi:hypothetical protein